MNQFNGVLLKSAFGGAFRRLTQNAASSKTNVNPEVVCGQKLPKVSVLGTAGKLASPFSLFLKENILKGFPGGYQMTRLSKLWKSLAESEKQLYFMRFSGILEEYRNLPAKTIEGFIQKNRAKKVKRRRLQVVNLLDQINERLQRPKKNPPTPYMLFYMEHYRNEEVRVMEIADKWNHCADEIRAQYYFEHAKLRSVYEKRYREWENTISADDLKLIDDLEREIAHSAKKRKRPLSHTSLSQELSSDNITDSSFIETPR